MQVIDGKQYLKTISGGFEFTYDGHTDHMSAAGYAVPTKAAADEIVTDLMRRTKILLPELKVFVFPYRLRTFADGTWTMNAYNGMAYDNHAVIGSRNDGNYASTITHEVFHIFQKKYISDLGTYKQLRDIPWNWSDTGMWEQRPKEIFAEDFRYLFGSPEARKDEFYIYESNGMQPPNLQIKDLILKHIPPVNEAKMRIGSKNLYKNGTLIMMDTAPVIQNSRTMLPVRYAAEALDATILWDGKTQEVTILKERG